MNCVQCEKQIDEDSTFCRHCGAGQAAPTLGTHTKNERQASSSVPVYKASRVTSRDPAERKDLRGHKRGNGWIWAAGAVACILIVGAVNSPAPQAPNQSSTAPPTSIEKAKSVTPDESKPPEATVSSAWNYSTDQDKVRGATSYYASTSSTNSIAQEFPYNSETTMEMTVRKHPAYGTDVVLTISSGQMMCPSYEGCSGNARFDNGQVQPISFNGPDDSSNDTIFVKGAKPFIEKLKKSKHVVIEKTLYNSGSPQFEFDVAGLKWDH